MPHRRDGEIYKNAESVLVLLPSTDIFPFSCLMDFKEDIMQQDAMGLSDYETVTWETFDMSHSMLVNHLISELEDFKRNLDRSVYFERGWTFQKLALARDVHVACEGVSSQVDSILVGSPYEERHYQGYSKTSNASTSARAHCSST